MKPGAGIGLRASICQRPKHAGDRERGERHPQMSEGQPLKTSHRQPSPVRPDGTDRGGTTRTIDHIWLCPMPQYSWHGISRSPVLRENCVHLADVARA